MLASARPIFARRSINAGLQTHATRHLSAPSGAHTPRQQSWLTRKVKQSPTALSFFLAVANTLGYGNARQVAGRRALLLYEQICAVRADEEGLFWQNECHLPPTFQSWFTVTNLHIWLLTVRLRALQRPHGLAHIQSVIDHFFMDVEDRIRAVLQPGPTLTAPYTFTSKFYASPSAVAAPGGSPARPAGRAPDRVVSRQMKIFKEQWAGMGMSLDLGLVRGDAEMAGAVWRNLLGARGARGIVFDAPLAPGQHHRFRRSVNLVGGQVEDVAKIDARGLDAEEARDDGSGVHDFAPGEADKYVGYPEVMYDVVAYLRRELSRLEKLSDDEVMSGKLERMRFGSIRGSHLRCVDANR